MKKTTPPDSLMAISPSDGRYLKKTEIFRQYFSEFAIFRYRLLVETEYLLALSAKTKIVRKFRSQEKKFLKSLIDNFDLKEAQRVKEIEAITRHDVKAIEYYLKEKIEQTSLKDVSEMVHFGLTSDDVNNLAYGLILKETKTDVISPAIDNLTRDLIKLSRKYKRVVMLGRTHGQPAVPTTMGKELAVFVKRIIEEKNIFESVEIAGKLNGAVGNLNAHYAAYPKVNWLKFSAEFIKSLRLKPELITTQILPYDSWIRVFDSLRRINTILIGFSQDMWHYISRDYFSQKIKREEIGSSTMPQKVNPIDFERAEGHLGLANALLQFFAAKLPISRLQRDLSDSTIRREIGLAMSQSFLGYESLRKGLERVELNEKKLKRDLEENWGVIAEGLQTILRSVGYPKPYEALKKLTRGKKITKRGLDRFIESLDVNSEIKTRLKILSPFNYVGLAEKLTESILKEV